MGVQLRYGTAGATGGGWSAQSGSLPPEFAEFCHESRWSWQCRSPKTWRDRNAWRSCWSGGASVQMGSIYAAFGAGEMGGMTIAFEPFSCDGDGSPISKFLLGQCVDASGNVAAGATVQAFRTSDDAFAGEVQANGEDGRFAIATPYTGQNHYLVAYKPGSPDIGGTTVNTLVPANIDGT